MNAALSAYCSDAIGRGSQSFAKATRLFPAETRESVIMLYAWCRHCDDVIDNQRDGKNLSTPSAATIGGRLEELRELTLQALEGAPQGLPFMALHQVCRQHGIPPRLPLDLLQGFEMDATACSYETIEDTLLYCYHVAGVVGVMMACIMGVREESTLQRACDLGLAFQLTNISRDVLEDAAAGRCYLPESWLEEAGLCRKTYAAPEKRQPLAAVACRVTDHAEQYYSSARAGLTKLPYRSAWAVATAHDVYRDIGLMVSRRGPAALERRTYTSPLRKALRVGTGAARAALSRMGPFAPSPRTGLWTPPLSLETLHKG